MRRRLSLDALTIKAALVLGFGLTLGLWLFAGYYIAQRVAQAQRDAATINGRYMQAQEILSTVRGQILLGSVYVRDALMDPDPVTADGHRHRLENTYRAVDLALRQYVPVLDTAAEREHVGRLQLEVDVFRTTMLEVLGSDRSRWPTEARLLLNRQVVPRREAVFRVAEETQALNRAAFVEQQRAIAEIYQDLQGRVWQRLGFVLALSLGIALVATLYSGRLENRLRRQRAREAQNALDLQHLSARLIKVQEEERRTIARELHDEVGQVLMAIKVELVRAQRVIEARGGPAQLLNEAQSITDGAVGVVRDLSQLLHPALLDDLGLPAAIDWYVQGFARRHAIEVDLRHSGMDERLAPEIEAAAFRIVQEALTNVAKHARADTCHLRFRRLPDTLLITIEDDGSGFDTAAAEEAGARRGLGLIGIRERVLQLHGTVRLASAPETGTRLTVELPLHAPAATEAPEGAAPSAPRAGFAGAEILHE